MPQVIARNDTFSYVYRKQQQNNNILFKAHNTARRQLIKTVEDHNKDTSKH